MGMDLHPINPSADAPCYAAEFHYAPWRGKAIQGQYSWSGWNRLLEYLEKWGDVPLNEFAGTNDGDIISDETCKKVADSLERHLVDIEDDYREEFKSDIVLWRTCGGYKQY